MKHSSFVAHKFRIIKLLELARNEFQLAELQIKGEHVPSSLIYSLDYALLIQGLHSNAMHHLNTAVKELEEMNEHNEME